MTYEWEKKRLKSSKQARRWLIDSLRKNLLPVLLEQGFVVAPLVHRGPIDRELVLQLPLGRLRRPRGDSIDLIEIELAPYPRPAFRISAGAAPKEGVATFTGRWAAEDTYVGWLNESFQMTPGARVRTYFSKRHWPWQTRVQSDYEQLVLHVVGFVPELELALREGRLGPHVRRITVPSLVFEGEGPVDDLRGTCPTLSFRVNGFDIAAHAGTSFSPPCSQLKSGDYVKVYGVRQPKRAVRATIVQGQ